MLSIVGGLRCGEMIALERRDVDLAKQQLYVERSDWNGRQRHPRADDCGVHLSRAALDGAIRLPDQPSSVQSRRDTEMQRVSEGKMNGETV